MRTTSDKIAEITQLLEMVRPLRDEVKRRSMIFDCELKEHVARLHGKPVDAYHDLPFREWVEIKRAYYQAP